MTAIHPRDCKGERRKIKIDIRVGKGKTMVASGYYEIEDVIRVFDIDTDSHEKFYSFGYPARKDYFWIAISSCDPLSKAADADLNRQGFGGMWDEGCDDLWYHFYFEFRRIDHGNLGGSYEPTGIVVEPVNHPDPKAPVYFYMDEEIIDFNCDPEEIVAVMKVKVQNEGFTFDEIWKELHDPDYAYGY